MYSTHAQRAEVGRTSARPLRPARKRARRSSEDRLARLRAGLKGRAEVRPTSARWAWVEYMLAQSGAEAGLAAFDAYRAGGAFAAFKRAFESRAVVPFLERRTPDGRRNPTVWPTVSAPAAAAAV